MSTPIEILEGPMAEAKKLLPSLPFGAECCIQLLATCLQESSLIYRRQHNNGPARGLAQMEQGTPRTRGGVTGVMLHAASAGLARTVCDARGVPWNAAAIWGALESDDTLAMAFARLLYWTSPKRFPPRGDSSGAWDLYLDTWRPGKPKPESWPINYQKAVQAVIGAQA